MAVNFTPPWSGGGGSSVGNIFQPKPKPPNRARPGATAPAPPNPAMPPPQLGGTGYSVPGVNSGQTNVGGTGAAPAPPPVEPVTSDSSADQLRSAVNPSRQGGGFNGVPPPAPQGQFGSRSFDPTYMLPQGGMYSSARPQSTAPTTPGVLTTPGALEQFWGRNSAAFDSPNAGEQTMADAAGIFRNKSNAQALYDSGNQGLNTFYDRELNKRQADLENRMSAAGVFGSGATAKAMYELQGELGASQARDMADLASRADQSEQGRASGLFGAGSGMGNAELDRLRTGGNLAGSVQNAFEKRERYPVQDQMSLAQNLSGIFGDMSTRTADEQRQIQEDIVQSLVAEAGMDRQRAEQMAQEWMQGAGLGIKAYEVGKK